ncbi:unnamed protein product [Boreogadus saida]
MCYGFCLGCWWTEYDPQTECDPLCQCISCYGRSQRTPALSSIQLQPRSRGLWCGNEASGVATRPVVWQRGQWCGNEASGVATRPVVWQRGQWCGNEASGVATRPVVWQRGLWSGNEASGHLTTTVLFLHAASLVPTRTRLAFCIDQPLLIPSKESFVLLQLSSNLVPVTTCWAPVRLKHSHPLGGG